MSVTRTKGSQLKAASIERAKLILDFLTGSNWNITNGANDSTITGLADPTNGQDAATKKYVDSRVQGLSGKGSVRALSDANLEVTGIPATVDGITLVAGDKILLVAQTDASENGIWEVSATAWSRPENYDTGDHASASYVFVQEGTDYSDQGWQAITDAPTDVIDTDDITWNQFNGAGEIIAGAGVNKNGNTLSLLNTDGSIFINATDIGVTIGSTNGSSLETSVSGVELKAAITGNRSFSAGTFEVDAGNNAVSVNAGTDTPTALSIGTNGFSVVAIGHADQTLGLNGSSISFFDAQVAAAYNDGPIPLSITPTVDYGNGNGTSIGDAIDQFRADFTDEGIINAICAVKAQVDSGVSKTVSYYSESPAVTNGSAVLPALTNLGTHSSVKVLDVRVYLNGIRQNSAASCDYTVAALTGVITFNFNLETGDVVLVDYKSQDA